MADALMAGGQPLAVTSTDPGTVIITFAKPFGPGLRLLDNLPILPKHVLEPALTSGQFASAWSLGTPVERWWASAPSCWPSTCRASGCRSLETRTISERIRPAPRCPTSIASSSRSSRSRRRRSCASRPGSSTRTHLGGPTRGLRPLKRAADAGRVQLLDLGVGFDPESFWINLRPGAFAGDPRASWLQRDELRQAISLAVDRPAFNDAVYLGAGAPAFGPVTPANRKWY